MRWHLTASAGLGVTIAMACVLPAAMAAAREIAPPQRRLRTYELRGKPRAVDISPDEKLAVVQVTQSQAATSDPTQIRTVELAQLWDFRQDRLVAEAQLEEVTTDKVHVPRDPFVPRFARFTADGQLIVIYLHRHCYVFTASLRKLRLIEISGPPDVTRLHKTRSGEHSSVETARLTLLEISPLEHTAAVVWVRGYDGLNNQVGLLDLDSGRKLGEWNMRDEGVGIWDPTALVWSPNGRQLVFAVPNAFRCSSPGGAPDIFVVDAVSGRIRTQWTSGLLIGDIAVTPDQRVWTVDSGCIGVFKNHDPKMKVFDLLTGKRVREFSGRESGVRYAVSASRKGDRVVAYTGKMKIKFDWGDMVSWSVPVDHTFSVWNSSNFEGLLTSQDWGLPRYDWQGAALPLVFRISAGGMFALAGTTIYELP